jgi:hypothetical protein
MKINPRDEGLDIYLESEEDIDAVLGLIGEGPAQDNDLSIEFRDAIGEAKRVFQQLRDQPTLFDETNRPPTVQGRASVIDGLPAMEWPESAMDWAEIHGPAVTKAEWDEGFNAGWRGDELVTPKSSLYMFAYEQGQVNREAFEERFTRDASNDG